VDDSVHIGLQGFSSERFLEIISAKYGFYNGNIIQRNVFSVLVNSFLQEEPTKLNYLSKRFEYIFREYLSANSNQTFLSGRLKERLLIDINDTLFKSNNESFFEFLSKNEQILTILDLTLENIKVMLTTYSTQLTFHQSHVESFKFKLALTLPRVLPTSDQFSTFMNLFNQGKDLQTCPVFTKDTDFCVTPKYHVYLGNVFSS
jgi:hypothetical protein